MNDQEEAIVNFDLFKNEVGKFGVKFTDEELDIAFVYLSRGIRGQFNSSEV